MIAADASVVISWMNDLNDETTRRFDQLTRLRQIVLPPVAITEVASGPNLAPSIQDLITQMPALDIQPGYWWRAGQLRARLIQSGRKARLGDALIAQACLDADLPLLTRDSDFRAFAEIGGLKLA